MFSLDRCRNIVGRECALDDEQLTRLRDQLYGLADVVLDGILNQQQINADDVLIDQRRSEFRTALNLLPESEREDVEERAAIIEFEGRENRDEAERKAMLGAVQKRSEKKNRN